MRLIRTPPTAQPGHSTPPKDAAAQRLAVVYSALLGLCAIWLFWRLAGFVHDDAFISLRYARNLAEHGQMVWNLGEWVEGYTNPLHIVTAASLIALGAPPLAAAQGVNVAGFVALIFFGWRLVGMATEEPTHRLAGLGALVSAPVIAWIYGGLEATPVAAALAAALYHALRSAAGPAGSIGDALIASAFFAVAYLFRPDAVVPTFFTGVALLAFGPGGLRRRFALCIAIGAVALAAVSAHVALRLSVYGELTPLTYFAKVDIEPVARLKAGARYLIAALTGAPALPVLLALVAMLAVIRRRPSLPMAVALTVIAGQAAYLFWSGGDHMAHFRLIVTMSPALALAIAAGLAAAPPRLAKWLTAGAMGWFTLWALAEPPAKPNAVAVMGAIAGRHIDATLPKDAVIALATAGSTPFFARERVFIDTLGLNDPVIAKRINTPIRSPRQHRPGHHKGDGAYVLSREPDVIILGAGRGRTAEEAARWFLTDIELIESEEFHRCYAMKREAVDASTFTFWPARAHVGAYEFISYRRICPKRSGAGAAAPARHVRDE